MLITLGLDSQYTILETFMTAMSDLFPGIVRKFRTPFLAISCFVLFLIGLTCATRTGFYYLNLMDSYAGSWGLLIVAMIEVGAISWIYGVFNFIKDIEMMIGEKPKFFWFFWIACWLVITPILVSYLPVVRYNFVAI